MNGTFAFCRTNEAIKRLGDGDVIQNIKNGYFFRKDGSKILVSNDYQSWEIFNEPFEVFPPYEEWKSVLNLHYYDDLEHNNIYFLSLDDRILDKDDCEADKTMKRWFSGGMLN